MSRDYILVCFDCKEYLSLGKIFWKNDDGELLDDVTFQGVFDSSSMSWRKRDEFFGRVLEKFLITHRNHELRFVPEGVDEMIENKFSCYVSAIVEEELLASPIEPDVDWWKEKENWMDILGEPNRE